jgi:hypothetical protein
VGQIQVLWSKFYNQEPACSNQSQIEKREQGSKFQKSNRQSDPRSIDTRENFCCKNPMLQRSIDDCYL